MRASTKQDLLAIAAIHALVRGHVFYSRIYSEKRSGDRKDVILGHRIKYYICNPDAAKLDLLDLDLKKLGLYAKRYIAKSHCGARIVKSLILQQI